MSAYVLVGVRDPSAAFNVCGRANMELKTRCGIYQNDAEGTTVIQGERISFTCKRNRDCIDADWGVKNLLF